MKFNFWQVLGVVILIAGVVLSLRKKTGTADVVHPPATAPTTTTAP